MIFKSQTQPLCRYCGKPIKKRTDTHYLWEVKHQQRLDPSFDADGKQRPPSECVYPQTKEDAQRLFNTPILSVGRGEAWEWSDDGKKVKVPASKRPIQKVSTWDGESYEDEFFCNGGHAKLFAYLMAEGGHCTSAYVDALKAELSK